MCIGVYHLGMKITEHVEHTSVRTLVKAIVCDMCKTEYAVDYCNGAYDINETEVTHTYGMGYPEGGHKTSVVFDICPSCFQNRLMPWLQSQGCNPVIDEIDW